MVKGYPKSMARTVEEIRHDIAVWDHKYKVLGNSVYASTPMIMRAANKLDALWGELYEELNRVKPES